MLDDVEVDVTQRCTAESPTLLGRNGPVDDLEAKLARLDIHLPQRSKNQRAKNGSRTDSPTRAGRGATSAGDGLDAKLARMELRNNSPSPQRQPRAASPNRFGHLETEVKAQLSSRAEVQKTLKQSSDRTKDAVERQRFATSELKVEREARQNLEVLLSTSKSDSDKMVETLQNEVDTMRKESATICERLEAKLQASRQSEVVTRADNDAALKMAQQDTQRATDVYEAQILQLQVQHAAELASIKQAAETAKQKQNEEHRLALAAVEGALQAQKDAYGAAVQYKEAAQFAQIEEHSAKQVASALEQARIEKDAALADQEKQHQAALLRVQPELRDKVEELSAQLEYVERELVVQGVVVDGSQIRLMRQIAVQLLRGVQR